MSPKQVIINGDDFGLSPAINSAVIRAHREGVLTSTSLMVAGEAFKEAVELARATSTLAVGLHLVISNGQAVLPRKDIPHLVDGNGRFPDMPLQVGLLYGFSHTAQAELAREMAAQFERFTATGLPLSHVDGHQHLHIHPMVFSRLLPLAENFGAHGLRLPVDRLGQALCYNHQRAIEKITWAIALGLVCRWCRSRLRDHSLSVPQQVHGLLQTGQMHKDYVVKVLRNLRKPTTELFFHPSTTMLNPLGPNPGDLETLLSLDIRRVIEEQNLHLATYPTLKRFPT